MLGRIFFSSPWSLVLSVFQKIKATLTDTYVFRLSRSPIIRIRILRLIFQIIRIWYGWNKIWIFRELKGFVSFTTYVLMTKLVCSKRGGLLLMMFMSSVIGIFTQKSFIQHLETLRKTRNRSMAQCIHRRWIQYNIW